MAVGRAKHSGPQQQTQHTSPVQSQATVKSVRRSSEVTATEDIVTSSVGKSKLMESTESRAPRVGHKKSRKGCAQCKRRHVKCNEEAPCSNCVRHGVPCSLAGGPIVEREDAKNRRASATSSSSVSRTTSQEASFLTSTATPSTTLGASTSPGESPSQPSPFAILTGLIDRPLPGEDKNWMLDLELMHHYMSHTKYILSEHQQTEYVLRLWQEETPKVAFSSDYVMHGLLGFSALHKAIMQPEEASMLRTSAVDHLDKALVLYRQRGGETTAENANAKFLFTWLVVLFAFAIPPSVPPLDAMVELFSLVKGIDVVTAETWFWVSQGPFAPIFSHGFQAITQPPGGYAVPEGMDFGLGHLDYMLGVEIMMPDDRRACALSLGELKPIYDNVLRTQGNSNLGTIMLWPKQDSIAFSKLVKRRVPQALVILAYYCVLLDVLDNRWWIHGWAARVLRDAMGSLGEQWRQWIEWPVQAVLLKEPQPPDPTDLLL